MPTDTDDDKMTQLQIMQKLASNPVALVVYALVAGGGAGFMSGGVEEDLEHHVHEDDRVHELRKHWGADERRRLEARITELEDRIENPPVQVDEAARQRLNKLEVEIGAAIRLLELQATRSPTGGASP